MTIERILQNHSVEVRGLLRRHKIAGDVSVNTINRAYRQKGEQFMMELLKIITPTSNYTTDLSGENDPSISTSFVHDPTIDPLSDEYLAAITETSAIPVQTAETGKFWKFWDQLLNTTVKTANSIGQAQNSINNPTSQTGANGLPIPTQSDTKFILWIAAGFVAIILLILILKK